MINDIEWMWTTLRSPQPKKSSPQDYEVTKQKTESGEMQNVFVKSGRGTEAMKKLKKMSIMAGKMKAGSKMSKGSKKGSEKGRDEGKSKGGMLYLRRSRNEIQKICKLISYFSQYCISQCKLKLKFMKK
jgi:hypothetical protein